MTKTIVLLSGWASSGKDAAASLLVDEMNFMRLAFADMLKEDVSEKTGIPLSVFHNHTTKDTPVAIGGQTPRQLLLAHALAVRLQDPDIYSRKVAESVRDSYHGRFVISDWRYKDEYTVIRTMLEPTRIIRGRIVRTGLTASDDPSEHDLDDESFDFTVMNDGCISDLRDALKHELRQRL